MPSKASESDQTAELLKDILIVQLGQAGVKQKVIRQIVGCSIGRVNRIVKHLKPTKNRELE
jgi:hypothetical protein